MTNPANTVTVRCENPRCGREFTRVKRRGRPVKFCSTKCVRQAYEDRHKRTTRISRDELRRTMALLMCDMLVEAGVINASGISAQKLAAIVEKATSWRNTPPT